MTLPAGATAPSQRVNVGRLARLVLAVLTAAYLAWLLVTNWRDISRAVFRFQAAQTRWLLTAIGLEIVSQSCAVVVQRRLLRRAGANIGFFGTVRLVLAQNAITMAVPAGQAAASVFSYRHIRRRGSTSTAAMWVVGASNVTTMLAVATFGAFTATGFSWLTVFTGSLLVLVAWIVVTLARKPEQLRREMLLLTRLGDRVRRRTPSESADDRVDARVERLRAVQMRWFDWLLVGTFALLTVAADCAVWFTATRAIIVLPRRCGVSSALIGRAARQCATFHFPTVAALLAAYSAGQAGLQLPVPFGLGVVESFMTAALTTAKVQAIPALSAVFLYRIISFWSVVALGSISWLNG